MTIDDFWRKYNHCPHCRSYAVQGHACDGCKWYFESHVSEDSFSIDKFDPTDECIRKMNMEVDE